jgi:NAD(P)H dehydrogenase (quinone)
MTLPELAITGSTGHLRGLVARELVDRGVPVRLLARDPDRAPVLPGAVAVASAYENTERTRAALEGTQVLFMVSASENVDRLAQHRTFVDAAAAAGVRHVVYTSFAGAAPDATFTLARDHWATEQHILDRGLDHTFLRDNFYIDFLPSIVGEDGVIRGPAGTGRVAAVTRADIAQVAATVLRSPTAHVNTTYELTGPEAITMEEVARILSAHTGRSISYHDETVEEAYESRRRWDAPDWQYDAWVSTYTAIAAGELGQVTDDVRSVTGHAPAGLAEWLDRRAGDDSRAP